MATSGSYDYLVTARTIVKAALRSIKAIGAGEDPVTSEMNDGLEAMNMLIKQWNGRADFAPGIRAFSRKRITLFLNSSQNRYYIGPGAGDSRATARYGRTTISADEAAAQTVLSIASNSYTTSDGQTVTMAANDFIGIGLDDATVHWTSIVSATSSSATITTAIPSSAATGRYVWWFTSRSQRLVQVESCVIRDEYLKDVPIEVYTDAKLYDSIADKNTQGDAGSILVEPQISNTAITLDTIPTDLTKALVITGFYPSEDFDSANDDPGFSQIWYRPLKYALARELAPEFGSGLWTNELNALYVEAMAIAKNDNPETSDVFFEPDR
jgi:hypothetical protein